MEFSAPIAPCRTDRSASPSSAQQRLERAAVAEPCQRGGRGGQQLAIVVFQQRNQRRHRARVADSPEGDDRGAAGVDVVTLQLTDQALDHRGAETDDGFEQLVLDARRPQHVRQRAFDGVAAQPAEHQHERSKRRAGRLSGRLDQAARSCGRDRRAHQRLDVRGAAAEHLGIPPMDAGQGVHHARGRGVRHVEHRNDRRDRILVSDLPQQLCCLIAHQFVAEERKDARRHRGAADARQRVERRKGKEEIVRLSNRRQRFDRGRRPEGAERLDRMEADVDILVVECREQSVHRLRTWLRAERERDLNPEIGVRMPHQVDQRRGEVDAGHGQQLECAAQDAEIAVPLPQRGDERIHQRWIPPSGHRLHRRTPYLPIVVGHRGGDRAEALDRIECRQPFDRAPPSRGAGVAQFTGELMLDLEALGDILDGDDEALHPAVVDQGRQGRALPHVVVARRGRGRLGRDQILVKGGREDARRAGHEGVLKDAQQPARLEIRHHIGERPADRLLARNAGHRRQRGIPTGHDQPIVSREDTDATPRTIGSARLGRVPILVHPRPFDLLRLPLVG